VTGLKVRCRRCGVVVAGVRNPGTGTSRNWDTGVVTQTMESSATWWCVVGPTPEGVPSARGRHAHRGRIAAGDFPDEVAPSPRAWCTTCEVHVQLSRTELVNAFARGQGTLRA
jgi:hypothetical protein